MPKLIDLTGQRFGRLVVIKWAGKDKQGNYLWLCRCNCKNEIITRGYDLKSGNTKSCGCFKIQRTIERMTKHGHSQNNKTYVSWYAMIQRCTNLNNERYKDYGGRGITVCKRWRKFENFLEDMGERPPKCTIERKNNNKGYYKKNCKWATSIEQNRNSRHNCLIIYNGKTQCLAVWAEEYNILYNTLLQRLRRNWSIEGALTTPVKHRRKKS